MSYWHYIKSFSSVGFMNGYYTLNEIPALFSAVHYDVHGPLFQMMYGSLAHFFGWQPYSAIFYNIVILAAGIVIFSQLAALNIRQLLFLIAVLSVFWVIPLYLVSPNQEPVHLAAALVFAGVFGRLMFISRRIPAWGHALFWLFLLYLSLMRFSWCLLAIPYLILTSARISKWSILRSVIIGGAYTYGVMTIFRYIAAPGLNSIVGLMDTLSRSVWEGVQTIALRFMADFVLTFGIGSPEGLRFGNWQACIYIALLTILLVIGLGARRMARTHSTVGEKARTTLIEVSFHWYQLGVMLLLSWLLYIPNGYERVLGAHLLLSLALLIAARRERLVLGLSIALAIAVPRAALDFVHDYNADFNINMDQFQAASETLAQYMPYQVDAPSSWCNTVLLQLEHYDWHVIAIPAGIGVSFAWSFDKLPHQPRSRYVLATESELEPFRKAQPPVQLLWTGQLPDGLGIYVNESIECQHSTE
ncbi:MAG: hypothetical protein KF716_32315 [Anaerolineae bacterium]|nr:hypothetical protein [Anaerolineae bacterium]